MSLAAASFFHHACRIKKKVDVMSAYWMVGSIRRFVLSGALVGLGKVRTEILFEVTPPSGYPPGH